jgi:heme-degrading monooxygenase HmoA
MHIVIWEFRARPGREADFERAYGPAGDWATLFGQAPGYLGTELLRDQNDRRRFITIDRWVSATAYDTFRAQSAGEYAAIDRRCEALTEYEALVGVMGLAGREEA